MPALTQRQNATGRLLPCLAWRGRSLLWSLIEGFKEFKLGWRGGIRRRARERGGERQWKGGEVRRKEVDSEREEVGEEKRHK